MSVGKHHFSVHFDSTAHQGDVEVEVFWAVGDVWEGELSEVSEEVSEVSEEVCQHAPRNIQVNSPDLDKPAHNTNRGEK